MKFEDLSADDYRMLRAAPQLLSDLLLVVAYLVVMDAVEVSGQVSGPLLAILGFPVLFYVPGYAVLAALFPRYRNDADERAFAGVSHGALSTFERTLLSFGVSLALLPPIALGIEAVGARFTASTVLLGVNTVVVTGVVVAAVRRFQLYDSGELTESRLGWFSRRLTRLSYRSRADAALTVLLVLVAVVATSTLGMALVAPDDGESYTTVALLTEDAAGNLTTAGHPATLTAGTSEPFVLAVENHEDRRVEYTVVGELQRVDRVDGTTSVVEETELVRRSRSVADGDTWRANLSVAPSMTGDDLRLTFLVYRGDPPKDPRIENADEHVHIWVDVSP